MPRRPCQKGLPPVAGGHRHAQRAQEAPAYYQDQNGLGFMVQGIEDYRISESMLGSPSSRKLPFSVSPMYNENTQTIERISETGGNNMIPQVPATE